MKTFLAFSMMFAALGALAFEPADWLGKRQMMMREAERLATAFTNCASRIDQPAEGVAVPVETFDDGAVKLLMTAKKAQLFMSENLVWAEGVVVIKYDKDGEEKSRVEADRCVVDRMSKSGWAAGKAKVVHGKTVFTGEDVYFSSPEGYVISTKKSGIETTDMKFGGAL